MPSVYCSNCGSKLISAAQFCSNCGKKAEHIDLRKNSETESARSLKPDVSLTSNSSEGLPSISEESQFTEKSGSIRNAAPVLIIAMVTIVALVIAIALPNESSQPESSQPESSSTSSSESTIGNDKPCSDSEWLKTKSSGGRYFSCAEGPNGLTWQLTESPSETKKRNNALAADAANAKWVGEAVNAWSNVASSANYALQGAKTYDTAGTGHTVPNDIRILIFNLGVSASNAAKLYAIAPDQSAATWAQKALTIANELQNLRQRYQSQGEETLSAEISTLLGKVGSAGGYAVVKN